MNLPKREQTYDSNYLRLNGGESIIFIPRGEILEFTVEWINKKPVYDTPNGKIRYKFNVLINNNSVLTPKIFEFGTQIYDALVSIKEDLKEEGLDLDTTRIKVTRRGTGLDTDYSVVALGQADARTLKTMADIPLLTLGTKAKQTESTDDDDKLPW